MASSVLHTNAFSWEQVFAEEYNIVSATDTSFTTEISINGVEYRVTYSGSVLLGNQPRVTQVSVTSKQSGEELALLTRFPSQGDTVVTWPVEQLQSGGFDSFVHLMDSALLARQTGSDQADIIVGVTSKFEQLFGGRGNDTLIGGAGADSMSGGEGFDYASYESSSTGIYASLSGLPEHNTGEALNDSLVGIEGLIGSIYNDHLVGDHLGNHLLGGNGNDTLSGSGGNDTLVGGAGNDTAHFRGNRADYDITDAGGGYWLVNDRVASRDGADLITSIEFLQFADQITSEVAPTPPPVLPKPALPQPLLIRGTSRNDRLTGDAANDTIYGASGNDVLQGLDGNDRLHGGLGKDTLYGGKGKDIFVFDTKANKKTNLDKIADFNVKDDTIWLENKVFAKLGKKGTEKKPAALNKKFFTLSDKAKDKDDYIVYDNKKGILYYDADGSGAGKAVEIATLSKKLKMTYKDFFVI